MKRTRVLFLLKNERSDISKIYIVNRAHPFVESFSRVKRINLLSPCPEKTIIMHKSF